MSSAISASPGSPQASGNRCVAAIRSLCSPRGCAVWTVLAAAGSLALLTYVAVRIPTSLFGCGPLQIGLFFYLVVLFVSLFFVTASQLKSLSSNRWSWQLQADSPPGILPAAAVSGPGVELSKRSSVFNDASLDESDQSMLLAKTGSRAAMVPPGRTTGQALSPFSTSRTATCFRVMLCSLCILSVGILVAAAALLAHLRAKTLPDYSSTLDIPGLSAPASLWREAHTGILHIQATNDDDLMIAQGFAQAQTRFWQLEFQRRVGSGTLSEIVGDGGLDIDKTMRTLGVYKAAHRAVNEISPSSLRILSNFSQGVNAYINMMQKGEAATPLEMLVIPGAGYTVQPWTPADSLVWAKVMAYSLAGNLQTELTHFELYVKQNLTLDRVYQLQPFFDAVNFPTILTQQDVSAPYFPGNLSAVRQWSTMYGANVNVDSFLGPKGVNDPIMAALNNARNMYQQSVLRGKQGLLKESAPPSNPSEKAPQDDDINEQIRRERRALREENSDGETSSESRSLLQRVLSLVTLPAIKPTLTRYTSNLISRRRRGTNTGGGARASNSWVVGGPRTKSGLPLLSNDPHLDLMAPSIWMLTHLKSPTRDVMGSSFPGIPGVVLGRAVNNNITVAWAVTNTGIDVQDLYIMQERPHDSSAYFYQGKYVPYDVETQIIKVAGGDDVSLQLRSSVYGTVVTDNDVFDGYGSSMSLRWVSTDPTIPDTTMDAFFGLMTVTSFADFRASLSAFIGPSQNFIFASSNGEFGYQTSGYVPLRAPNQGFTGALPVPGTGDPLFDWKGRIPFDVLPATLNPAKGFVATANNRVSPVPDATNPGASYNIFLTSSWDEGAEGYRAERITNMILASTQHDVASMQGIQQDYYSGWARDFLAIVGALPNSFIKTAGGVGLKNRLGAFSANPVLSIGSRDATLYVELYQEVAKLGTSTKASPTDYWGNPIFIRNALQSDATGTSDPACLAAGFPSCNAYLGSLLDNLASKYHIVTSQGTPQGGDLSPNSKTASIAWGIDVHQAIAIHQILDGTPLQCLADRQVSHGGDDYTVDVGHIEFDGESDKGLAEEVRFAQIAGSSFRHISDLSNPEVNSKIVNFMGENGAILAEGNIGLKGNTAFDSELTAWAFGGYSQMTMDLTRLGAGGDDDDQPVIQTLNPA